jgi:hypothetical protein
MITVRYHIASLCAVILMLGIGIWIGLIINSAALEKNLIRSYRVKLAAVQQERHDEAALLAQNRQALAVLVSRSTRSTLVGKRIAILRTGDYSDAAQNATDALADTGAIVVSSTTISDGFDDVTEQLRVNILGALANSQPWSQALGDNTSLYMAIAQALKSGTANKADLQSAIDKMSSAGLISYSGDFHQPADLVIIVGGFNTDVDQSTGEEQDREKAVVDQLLSPSYFNGSQVVGCEVRESQTSSIPLYSQEGIASVDCIDEPIGELDLAYALRGESGTYGMTSSAHLLVPSSLTPASGT